MHTMSILLLVVSAAMLAAVELRRRKFEAWAEKRRMALNTREAFTLAEADRVRREAELLAWKMGHFKMAVEGIFGAENLPAVAVNRWVDGVTVQRHEDSMRGLHRGVSEEIESRVAEHRLPILRIDADVERYITHNGLVFRVEFDGSRYGTALALDRRWLPILEDMPILEDHLRLCVREVIQKISRDGFREGAA